MPSSTVQEECLSLFPVRSEHLLRRVISSEEHSGPGWLAYRLVQLSRNIGIFIDVQQSRHYDRPYVGESTAPIRLREFARATVGGGAAMTATQTDGVQMRFLAVRRVPGRTLGVVTRHESTD